MVVQFILSQNQRDFNRLIRADCGKCFDGLYDRVTGKTQKSGKKTVKLKVTEERKVVEEPSVPVT